MAPLIELKGIRRDFPSGDEMLTVTKISGDSQIAEMNSDR